MNRFFHLKLLLLKAYVIIGFAVIVRPAYSQNQKKADSLIYLLELRKSITDSLKLEILSGIFINHTNLDVRIKYANEAFNIAKSTYNQIWLHRSTLNLGHAYKKKGDLKKALEAYFQSASFAKEINYKKGEASAYTAIGSVYRVQENYPTALYYYNLGIEQFRIFNDSTQLAVTLMNTGDLYRTTRQFDTALLYFKESGEIFYDIHYKIGSAYTTGNIGLVYAEQNKYALAEKYMLEATNILTELGDNYPIAVYNASMAEIYQKKGNMAKAFAYAHNSYELAKANGLKEQLRDASLMLSELYEAQEDFKTAYLFKEEYLAYRDSINNEETVRAMADLRTEYEVAQKQIEVDLLNQEKKINRIVGAALFGVILLIGTLAIVLNKRNKEKRLTNKILTEQKQQLELQHDELEKLNATKNRFFSIISHDLRGPVNAFKGLSTLIQHSVIDKKYDDISRISDLMDASSNQLSFLLDNLLDWAVNQQGEFPYRPEKIEFKALAVKTTNVLHNMAQSKAISLSVEVVKDVTIWADYNSTRTILRNLVSNAIKFTAKGGAIKIVAALSKNFAEIKIIDNGIGISKEKLGSLFLLNEKKNTSGTEGEKGLGLGLRLAYEFTKMNKGSISVESEEGVGTTFMIKLPLVGGGDRNKTHKT